MHPPHPLRVAARQIIVDGNDMNTLAFKGVQVAGQGRNQRFAFAGLHFGDPAFVENDAANQLNVEVAHVENAPARFSRHCERLDQDVVQFGAVRDSLLEIDRFGSKIGI